MRRMRASPYLATTSESSSCSGGQIQVVRNVEVVRNERAFDPIGSYVEIEVAEGNRVTCDEQK